MSEINIKRAIEDVDNYEQSVLATACFIHIYKWDNTTKRIFDDVCHWIGKEYTTAQGAVTPDITLQLANDRGLVVELKPKLPQYVCAPVNALAHKPVNLSFEEAACVPEAALVALQGLRDAGKIKRGCKVLICGASGGIGSFAVQIAKSFGAEVTGVCGTRNFDLVRKIGADHVIDYAKEDFSRNGKQYDLILATAGYRSIFDYMRALSPNGIYVATGGSLRQVFEATLLGPLLSAGGKKMGSMLVKVNKDLVFMKELIDEGEVKPVIDRCYPLCEAVEALGYYQKGHAKGRVVISVEHNK